MPLVRELGRIADLLLCTTTSSRDLAQASTDLYECLSAPVRGSLGLDEAGTSLPSGLAISPAAAAACIRDPMRTAIFLRAVDAALAETLRRFPGETIEVVYAGTGPLAPLVIPLLPRLAESPVRFTFLDVHAGSVEATRVLAEHFGVARSIRAFVTGDATRYEHPQGLRLHGLISETMQSALSREPQVAVMRQIAPQLVPEGFMVPESVRVDLIAGDPEWARESHDERDMEGLGLVQTLFELRAGIEFLPLDASGCLPPAVVRLPPWVSNGQAFYGTFIVAYRDHVLAPGQSGLTLPQVIPDLMSLQPGMELEFRYRVGPDPGFLWRVRSTLLR